MKYWKKIAGIFVGMAAVCVVAILLFGDQKECCLCNRLSAARMEQFIKIVNA